MKKTDIMERAVVFRVFEWNLARVRFFFLEKICFSSKRGSISSLMLYSPNFHPYDSRR